MQSPRFRQKIRIFFLRYKKVRTLQRGAAVLWYCQRVGNICPEIRLERIIERRSVI